MQMLCSESFPFDFLTLSGGGAEISDLNGDLCLERALRRLLGWAGADAALECACINYDDSLESPSR